MQKTNPKTSPCTFLVRLWPPFPFYYVDARARMFPKHAIEVLRAWRGLGEATPRTQNVLAWGQSEADSKLYDLLLKFHQGWTWSSWCLCCLARILSQLAQGRPQGKPTAFKVMEIAANQNRGNRVGGRPQCKSWTPVLARPWKLEQNTSEHAKIQRNLITTTSIVRLRRIGSA